MFRVEARWELHDNPVLLMTEWRSEFDNFGTIAY